MIRIQKIKKLSINQISLLSCFLALWARPSLLMKLKSSFSMKEASSEELLRVSFFIINYLEIFFIPIRVVIVFYCLTPIAFKISSSTMFIYPRETWTQLAFRSKLILLMSSFIWYSASDITLSSGCFFKSICARIFSYYHR